MNYHEIIPKFFELSQPLLGTPLKMSNVSNSQPATIEATNIDEIIEAFQVISRFLHQIELKSSTQQRQAWKQLFKTPFPL